MAVTHFLDIYFRNQCQKLAINTKIRRLLEKIIILFRRHQLCSYVHTKGVFLFLNLQNKVFHTTDRLLNFKKVDFLLCR